MPSPLRAEGSSSAPGWLVRCRGPAAVVGLLALIGGFQISAIRAHSLSGDGAHHLIAGHNALRYGTSTVNLEHPPLAKLVMAAPSRLLAEPLTPPVGLDGIADTIRSIHRRDDIERHVLRARTAILLLVVLPLLAACYALGARWGGGRAGLLLTAMVFLSFPAVGRLTLLQTDAAVTLGFVLTMLAAVATIQRPGPTPAALLGLAWGVAMASKFSALLLAPTIAAALMLAHLPLSRRSLPRLAIRAAATAVTCALVLGSSYALANLDYDRELGRATIRGYAQGQGQITDERMRATEPMLLAVEHRSPGLAQWLTGVLAVRNQNAIGVYPSYAFGVATSEGRWWYHPVQLLTKTPLAILVAAIGVGVARARGRADIRGRLRIRRRDALIAITVIVYIATAMLSNYNLGYRHLLPIVPLLYLPLAVEVAGRPRVAGLLVAALAIECLALAPGWSSATNTWWAGAHDPTRTAFAEDVGQNLKLLRRAADRRGIEELVVVDPINPPAAIERWTPGSIVLEPGAAIEPGWYAVNVTLEQMVPALLDPGSLHRRLLFGDALRAEARRWEPLWRNIVARGDDHGIVAGTFRLFRVGSASPPPDVLLITIDTLRADHLGSYGARDIRTPRLDAMAAEGMLFENATTVLPETRPAHVSLFTSRYPDAHGVDANSAPLADLPTTLASWFAASGHATGGFAGCLLFDEAIGAQLGFEHFDAPTTPQRPGAEVVDGFLAWREQTERPYFAWVHLFDPHMPYAPPAPFDRPDDPLAAEWPTVGWPELLQLVDRTDGAVPEEVLERARALYAGEVEYVDQQVGRLVDALRDDGSLDRTVLIVTADHGECLEEGVYFEHSSCLSESALRVPLLVRYPPQVEGGVRVGARVELLDVAPTMLRLAGLPIPASFAGSGLLEHVDEPLAASTALFRTPAYTALEVEQRDDRNRRMRIVGGDPVRPIDADLGAVGAYVGRWKLTLRASGETLEALVPIPDAGLPLRTDALERARGVLADWAERLRIAGDADAIDPRTLAILRSLGYLSDVPERP